MLVELEGKLASGQGVSTDTLEASARAYLRALSNALAGVTAVGSPTEPPSRRSSRRPTACRRPTSRDFTWLDGERLIRFGEGALAEAPALLGRRGLRRLRAADRRERALAAAPALAPRRAPWSTSRPGRCPRRPRPFAATWTAGRWSRSAAAA